MKIILLGPPGSGKGTQAKLLKEKLNFKVISVGEILRKESKRETKLGKFIDEIIDKGKLIPDTLANRIVKRKIKLYKDNFVIDGYPRDLKEAVFIYNLIKIDKIFLITSNKKVIYKRLEKRHKEMDRDDDIKKIIKNRFKVYEKKTIPAINYFGKKGILARINGNDSPNKVFKTLKSKLK